MSCPRKWRTRCQGYFHRHAVAAMIASWTMATEAAAKRQATSTSVSEVASTISESSRAASHCVLIAFGIGCGKTISFLRLWRSVPETDCWHWHEHFPRRASCRSTNRQQDFDQRPIQRLLALWSAYQLGPAMPTQLSLLRFSSMLATRCRHLRYVVGLPSQKRAFSCGSR